MRIAFLTSEITPYSKTGGLADVSGALPDALAGLGHQVTVLSPLHRGVRDARVPLTRSLDGLSVPVGVGDPVEPLTVYRAQRAQREGGGGGGAELYFLDHPPFFDRAGLYTDGERDYPDNLERFVFFTRGALEVLRALTVRPEIIHANDWQSALAPVYLKSLYAHDPLLAGARTAITIHNLAYQGLYGSERFPATGLDGKHFNWRELEFYGQVNLLKGAIVHADGVSTVSRRYAEEIQTPPYGFGLDGVLRDRAGDLRGIVNGIDVDAWDPATDPHLPAHYSVEDLSGKAECKARLQAEVELPQEPDVPLIGMVSRLVPQKGLDLLLPCLDTILERPLQVVILGAGLPEYAARLEQTAQRRPDRLAVRIGFDEALAHRIEAGADVFLMPSRFEPCGLNQMYSMRYGAVPLVHRTGGLADTVVDASSSSKSPVQSSTLGVSNLEPSTLNLEANGICFDHPTSEQLLAAVDRALALYKNKQDWLRLVQRGMAQDFSWAARAEQYTAWYRDLLASPPRAGPSVA